MKKEEIVQVEVSGWDFTCPNCGEFQTASAYDGLGDDPQSPEVTCEYCKKRFSANYPF